MAEELTKWDVVNAVAERAAKRLIDHTSRMEIGEHLGRSKDEVDPLVDEALEAGYLAEHDVYKGNYVLTDQGQEFLDSAAFAR